MQINDLPEFDVERAMGIEPTAQAWEAWVLPLYDARRGGHFMRSGASIQSSFASWRPFVARPRFRRASPPGRFNGDWALHAASPPGNIGRKGGTGLPMRSNTRD